MRGGWSLIGEIKRVANKNHLLAFCMGTEKCIWDSYRWWVELYTTDGVWCFMTVE